MAYTEEQFQRDLQAFSAGLEEACGTMDRATLRARILKEYKVTPEKVDALRLFNPEATEMLPTSAVMNAIFDELRLPTDADWDRLDALETQYDKLSKKEHSCYIRTWRHSRKINVDPGQLAQKRAELQECLTIDGVFDCKTIAAETDIPASTLRGLVGPSRTNPVIYGYASDLVHQSLRDYLDDRCYDPSKREELLSRFDRVFAELREICKGTPDLPGH